jgi:hypothetical protein
MKHAGFIDAGGDAERHEQQHSVAQCFPHLPIPLGAEEYVIHRARWMQAPHKMDQLATERGPAH